MGIPAGGDGGADPSTVPPGHPEPHRARPLRNACSDPSHRVMTTTARGATLRRWPRPPSHRHSSVFVGRTHELDQVRSVLDGARSGRMAALLVSGDAGVGKTRLIGRACAEATPDVVPHDRRLSAAELDDGAPRPPPFCPPPAALRPGAADAERPADVGRLVPEPPRGAGPVAGRHLPRAPGRRGRRRPPVGRREHARRAHVRPRRAARPAAGGAPHAAPRRGGCRPHAAAMAGRHPQDAVVRRTAARALRPHRDARAARRHPRHAAPRVAPQ